MSKGMLVIISAPSGTGKSTLCRELIKRRRGLRQAVTCTTRPPRPGEKQGRHYFFLSVDDFKRRVQRHEFLEWAVVHGEYYGTPRRQMELSLADGNTMLLAVDVQGAAAIRRKLPDAVLVFLAPPSWEALKDRLAARREAEGSAATRLANARAELSAAKRYDYLVINDDLSLAADQIECILTAESLKASRQELSGLPLLPAKEFRPRSAQEDT